MTHWSNESIFYHIYPLGLCGAPPRNDFSSPPVERLSALKPWLAHLTRLGANALYLGPLFESSEHGYDTADYFTVDRRLGTRAGLVALAGECRRRGVRLIFDAVFNHVGRDFWAFKDVQQYGEASIYKDWFTGLRFDRCSPYGDPFSYEGWNGHYNLVKLNLAHPHVRAHLFAAVRDWVESYGIDGLRLDAADVIDAAFLRDLAAFCRRLRPDFWLVGEVVHGDYRGWANPQTLDSVTNYECYKGLYSSLNDRNYFEIAYALNRQFGEGGLYRGLPLYAFADNHDVNRVASSLKNPAHLYPLYALLFTMPGVPSIYYGSEFGLHGEKNGSDAPLRPALDLAHLHSAGGAPHPQLLPAIQQLAALRLSRPALQRGDYRPLHVASTALAFTRRLNGEQLLAALNAADQPVDLTLALPGLRPGSLPDVLNGQRVEAQEGRLLLHVPPCQACVVDLSSAMGPG